MTSRAYGARNPSSHYDVILIVTSFATELATPTVTDVRYRHLRCRHLPRLIYEDLESAGGVAECKHQRGRYVTLHGVK